MPESSVVMGAVAPGVLIGVAVLSAVQSGRLSTASLSLAGRVRGGLDGDRPVAARRRLATEIARAGWRDGPARIVGLTLTVSGALAALGLSTAWLVDLPTALGLAFGGAAAGVGAVWWALHSAAQQRRRRLTRELAPLLELFVLELGGGGSALSALGSVTMQVDGELAGELRRLLIASQLTGSATFESRLRAYAETMNISPLGSLATILTASREYGTGVTQGVRALAADLRRAQRRELIAHSRRALNHVLFPAAIGVLLPFLAILLFPAVSSLQRNLR